MDSQFNSDSGYYQSWDFNEYSYYFTYHTIFFRPRLCLEFDITEPATFAPHVDINGVKYRPLKLRIRNTGHRTVHNCMAQLRVFIPRNNVDPMGFPTAEYKQLAWDRSTDLSDLTETTHIQGHNVSLVHIVFSSSNMDARYACVSKLADFHSNTHRTEDTFVIGHYVAEILITTDEGPYIKAMFIIEVNRNWDELTMHKMSWIRRKIWKLRNR